MKRPYLLLWPIALASCSPAGLDTAGSETPSPASTQTAPQATEPAPSPGRSVRYSALENCKLVREERAEMPYTETLCGGPAGWRVRIADADARQTMAVVAPDGTETRLDLSRASGGAFNAFGSTAEWRGPATGPFKPDALIVRFSVAEQPHPAPEVAYLLAIRLSPTPCLLARVAPGANQNAEARSAADGKGACQA